MTSEIADRSRSEHPEKMSRIKVIHGELLAQTHLDAIVSFLSEDLSWGGPVNQKIMEATRQQVDEYMLEHAGKLVAGDVFATPGFQLPHAHLIFAVIPKWDNNFSGDERILKAVTIKILERAVELGCQRIGIPSFSPGPAEFPLRKSARVIANALREAPLNRFSSVEIVCNSDEAYQAFMEKFA